MGPVKCAMEKCAIVMVAMIIRNPLMRYAQTRVGLYQKRKGRIKTLNKPDMKGIRFSSLADGACILVCRSHPPRARKKRQVMSVFLRYCFLVMIPSFKHRSDQETERF
jgi:hypothetical protein